MSQRSFCSINLHLSGGPFSPMAPSQGVKREPRHQLSLPGMECALLHCYDTETLLWPPATADPALISNNTLLKRERDVSKRTIAGWKQ